MAVLWLQVGAYGAAIVGTVLAVWQLHTNHDWNRRRYTADLLDLWDVRTGPHRRAIDSLYPGLVDLTPTRRLFVIPVERAEAIYGSTPGQPDWDLRFHLIELLNHLETVAAAFHYDVADRSMLEDSLRPVMVDWHVRLQHFISRVEQQRGYAPWGPYTLLIAEWAAEGVRHPGQTGLPWRTRTGR